ncbi:uroporphyrinogen decarboxylase [Rhabdaerophilum sp. SD176]|uniref:uroporphyrinogen decarboxylase n=1 Tax=Rhabdaerophilum sp. SD176 TaxID=2983548 RepID=UPI0024DF4508|nr:uroporphyrinogen decarboxylase [Rhabdaerophilum sp. SD176]
MKPFLDVLAGKATARPPIWLMRQAGRYLPEYRAIRSQARDFLHFCYSPELAIEATMQPIRRFSFDAAIIFSDILVIPDALGQSVRFAEGEGPRLEAMETPEALKGLASALDEEKLEPVYNALRGVRAALPPSVALIGFCGAPWTLATYMIGGRGTPDQAPARHFAYQHPEAFQSLTDLLVEACTRHLCLQAEAGAEALQIFDSWAGNLPERELRRWSEAPIGRIIAGVKARHPSVPIIAFPRGIAGGFSRFVSETNCDAISLDTACALSDIRKQLPPGMVTQGNLDPLVLINGGSGLDAAVDHILESTAGLPHVFNLGHGILPPTPIPHVEAMLRRVRG